MSATPYKTVYYEDESQDFAGTKINQKPLPHDHKYFHGPVWRFFAWIFYYIVASPVAWVIKRVWYREKVIGKEKLKGYKKQGFFLYGNHTRLLGDVFCPPATCYPKKAYVVANPDSVSIPVLGNLPEMLGCVPLPTDVGGLKNFQSAIKKHAEKGHVLVVYPEAKIWPYYTKIRPFPDSSFRYPVETGKPAFAMTVTFQKGKILKRPRSVTYIDGPFFADKTLSVKEGRARLCERVKDAMEERCKRSDCEYIRYVKIEEETRKKPTE